MSDIQYEFERNLKSGIGIGTKVGGFVGSTIASILTGLLFGTYNAWTKIKENELGGKDIEGGIDGKNEKVLLQKIADEYLGQVGYSEIENPLELQSAIENFDKEIWEKYCKEYNLNYSAVEEIGANGKIQTKINVSEKKARDLERVFKAYANEMQSKQRTKAIEEQWKLIDYKSKEKGIDIEKFKEEYQSNPDMREVINNKLYELNEKQKSGELPFGTTTNFVYACTRINNDFENHPKKANIITTKLEDYINGDRDLNNLDFENNDMEFIDIYDNTPTETEFIIPETPEKNEKVEFKFELSREDVLGEPGIERKIGNQTFQEIIKDISEKPDVKKQIEAQEMAKEKDRNKGELQR